MSKSEENFEEWSARWKEEWDAGVRAGRRFTSMPTVSPWGLSDVCPRERTALLEEPVPIKAHAGSPPASDHPLRPRGYT
jgi:hypothetical protein